MVSHQETRLNRIGIIKLAIYECEKKGLSVDKELLIKECCLKWGCTRRLIIDYFEVLSGDGYSMLDGGADGGDGNDGNDE